MTDENTAAEPERRLGLKSHAWRYSYKTSALMPDGQPVDMLHDFYIPVLKRSVRYDRVAGYFRSSSLAIASRGFSAFVGRQGKMRLIAGADFNPHDVQAILDGDTTRLSQRLNEELNGQTEWPDDVSQGVELLAWMIAHGHLEVRVAFRVHGQSGEPLPFGSSEDGYVHEKWGVLTDEPGQRMSFSGSLNESATALTHNAENIELHCDWWGEMERRRVEDAATGFEVLWEKKHPYLRVLELPEAVRKRLIEIGEQVSEPKEIDGTTAAIPEVEPPSTLERLKFALIADGPKLPGGRYVGLATAPVNPWPHQAVVARRLVETWPYNHLLCDEVGLGKTIEAGLAIRSLYLSGLVDRVLIAAPRSLTRQWQREMAAKFLMPFGRALTGPSIKHHYEFPFEYEQPATSLYSPNLAIVSTGLLSRKERLRDLDQAPEFDVVLVDEAHYARRKNSTRGTAVHPEYGHLYRAIHDHLMKRAGCLWLATATPMQLDAVEVSDLLRLTNRVGAFQFDPRLMNEYYEVLGMLVHNGTPTKEEWEFLRQAVWAVKTQDPLLWRFFEEAVIDGRIRSAVKQWLENGRTPRGSDLKNMLRLIFAASPLSRTMLRHTRSLLEIYREKGQLGANLAKRHILPVPKIVFNDLEKRAYDELEDYCGELVQQIADHSDQQNRNTVGFMLSFLRLRFASSLFAIRETLRRRRERVEATLNHLTGGTDAIDVDYETWLEGEEDEDDAEVVSTVLKNRTPEDLTWERQRLTEMLSMMEGFHGPSSKMQVLLDALQKRRLDGGRIKQTVIFTRFYDTLTDIVRRLRERDAGMLIGTYSGQGGQYTDRATNRLVGVEREQVKHRFLRGEIDVLVCTDAAAEGLNLQTADLLVNFDLPWNPMKVEQRIGRIDRIGQKHEQIFVLNLCYADSAEQIVYDRLLTRLVNAGSIVGTQQISMLPVTLEEFEDLAAGKLSEVELEKRAKERIVLFKQRTASMEIPAGDLYEIYDRLTRDGAATPLPVDLDGIWKSLTGSKYLRSLGCVLDAERPLFKITGVDNAPEKAALTIDREIFDKGLPDLEGRLHFASWGDPIFDAILQHVGEFELPPAIRRLSAPVDGLKAELIGYAVAAYGPNGERQTRLVTSLNDVEGLSVIEDAELTEEELKPLETRLADLARKELEPALAVRRLEALNEKAGRAQIALDYLVIDRLIDSIKGMARDGDLFWSALKDLEERMQDRDRFLVPDLPAKEMRRMEKLLLFSATIPTMGEDARMTAPLPLLNAALDAGRRIADAMKSKKSELKTTAVQARLQREAQGELANF